MFIIGITMHDGIFKLKKKRASEDLFIPCFTSVPYHGITLTALGNWLGL